MALAISEFTGILTVKGAAAPLSDGEPVEVHTTTGAKTLNDRTVVIRIKGTGTITWSNGKAESFDGVEYRGVRGGTVITIS